MINKECTKIPDGWKTCGVPEPNYECVMRTSKVMAHLYNEHKIEPKTIAPCTEGGMYLHYWTYWHNYSLFVEVYNDLSVSGLVNDDGDREVLYIEDVKGLDFNKLVDVYMGGDYGAM